MNDDALSACDREGIEGDRLRSRMLLPPRTLRLSKVVVLATPLASTLETLHAQRPPYAPPSPPTSRVAGRKSNGASNTTHRAALDQPHDDVRRRPWLHDEGHSRRAAAWRTTTCTTTAQATVATQ